MSLYDPTGFNMSSTHSDAAKELVAQYRARRAAVVPKDEPAPHQESSPSTGLSALQPYVDPVSTQLQTFRAVIDECFPELCLEVEAALSVIAVLRLTHAANPVALIYEGEPASGKSTVIEMFAGWPALTYQSDKFTPAAFVSHAANRSKGDLAEVDLLPKIKHRGLLTPELGPTFSGKDEDLMDKFSTLTRVLDGRGLTTDSGTHGQRGYQGDYFFVWLGGTTPIEDRIWRIMGKLGSRLVTWKMPPAAAVTVGELVRSAKGPSYTERLLRCTEATTKFLKWLFQFDQAGAKLSRRDVIWRVADDPQIVQEWIASCALLMARMRSTPQQEPDPNDERDRTPFTPARNEGPRRFYSLLSEIAQGHALVHGRSQLTEDDLPIVATITVSSMPEKFATVFRALIQGSGEMTRDEVQRVLGAKHHDTALNVMKALAQYGVLEFTRGTAQSPSKLALTKDWAWCRDLGQLLPKPSPSHD